MSVLVTDRLALKPQEGQPAFARHFQLHVLARVPQLLHTWHRQPQNAAVVPAAQPTVAGQDQYGGLLLCLAALEQRVTERESRPGKIRDDLGDLPGVGGRFGRAVHGFLEPRRRNQFHRPRDLADVSDCLQPFDDCTNVGHRWRFNSKGKVTGNGPEYRSSSGFAFIDLPRQRPRQRQAPRQRPLPRQVLRRRRLQRQGPLRPPLVHPPSRLHRRRRMTRLPTGL